MGTGDRVPCLFGEVASRAGVGTFFVQGPGTAIGGFFGAAVGGIGALYLEQILEKTWVRKMLTVKNGN